MNDLQCARLTRWLNSTSLPIPFLFRAIVLDLFVSKRKTCVKLTAMNIVMELDLADFLQAHMYLKAGWDRELSNWVAFFASQGRVFMDVGAHVGYFSLIMGRYGQPGNVTHAFEPTP